MILGDVKVCVVDSETGKPVPGAYVRGKKDWDVTDESGCTTLRYREDTVVVVRIGYRSVKSVYSDTIRLQPSPVRLKDVEVVAVKISTVEHLPFQVEVEDEGEGSGVFGPTFSTPDVSTSAYGSEYAKPVFRAFSVKRLTVLRDGFEVRDLSHGADHPLHLYGADVGSLILIKGSAGAVFGGGFGGTIYVKSTEAEFSKVLHRMGFQFTPNGRRTRGTYLLNVGNERLAALFGVNGGTSGDYTSGSGVVPNSFGRDVSVASRVRIRLSGIVPSFGLRYDVRSWGIPEERATSHSTHYETFLLLGGAGLNYQNTLQVEMCDGDTVTSIQREVLQGKYEFSFRSYSGVVRITHDRMYGGIGDGASKVEGYASLYGPLFVRDNLQIIGGVGGKVVGSKGDLSGIIGLSSDISGVRMGVSLARSFRFPTLYETHFVGAHHGIGRYDVGNPDLRREVSYEVQITSRRKFGPLILSLDGFVNYVNGFITVVPTGEEYVDEEGHRMGVYRWKNTDALFYGYTHGISFATSHGYLRLTYAYLRARSLVPGDTLLYLPVPDLRIYGRIERGHLFTRLSLRYVPDHGKALGDMGVGVRYRGYSLTVGIFNPLNVEWREPTDPLGTPVPGRSVYLSLRGEI